MAMAANQSLVVNLAVRQAVLLHPDFLIPTVEQDVKWLGIYHSHSRRKQKSKKPYGAELEFPRRGATSGSSAVVNLLD